MKSTEVFASCRRDALFASYTHGRLLATVSSKQDDPYSYRNDNDAILSTSVSADGYCKPVIQTRFQVLGPRAIFSQRSRRNTSPSTLPAEKMGSREELLGNEDRRHIISSTRSTKSRARDMSWGLKLPRVHGDNLKGAEPGSSESKSEGRTFVIFAMAYPGGQTCYPRTRIESRAINARLASSSESWATSAAIPLSPSCFGP
ncbi:hypothetical protein PISMIDRAFT_686466 [Pisolithus microcarpus 441]|uniref:Uncharacterized protein n=1 Tax=Pisolithus microcarpus 441 TaxID=765257 RepID=A0A0C9Z1Q5_9AGAM|nr:hypothetical protein PISMIDRAFT_686466 [Pisolithus microcarpus 441]